MYLRVPLLPKWIRWAAVLGLAGFIFYVSIVTVPPETVVDQGKPDLIPLDKWRHFVAYATLGYALAYATTDWEWNPRTLAVFVITVTVIYGVGIEFGQSFMPQRYFSVADAYANAFGGLLVIPLYLVRPYLNFIPFTRFVQSFVEIDQ